MNSCINILLLLVMVYAKAASDQPTCITQTCAQTISHFYFSNKTPDGKPYFKIIEYVDNSALPYFNQLKETIKKQSKEILDPQNGWISSIKKKISTDKQQAEKSYNELLTYNNTYLVISELFAPKLTEDFEKPTTTSTSVVTTRLSKEIIDLIKNQTRFINVRLIKIKNPNNPFFGFSLTRIIQESWATGAKNFLGKFTRFVSQTVPQNQLFYMTSILKTIFTKINSLIYWHYIVAKINQIKINPTDFQKIHTLLHDLVMVLGEYKAKISINVADSTTKESNMRFEAFIEIDIVTNVIQWITNNNTTIKTLIPPKPQPVGAQPIKEQPPLCTCPYLQTEINFNITPTDIVTLEQTKAYKTKVFEYLVKLAQRISAMQHDRNLLNSNNLIAQFYQLAVLYYQIWPSELKEELTSGRSPIITRHGEIQKALLIIKDMQLKKFNDLCTFISQNIHNYWIHQFSENKSQRNFVYQKMAQAKTTIKNWWTRRNYFFGFSLLTSSRKNSSLNRYTYIITQLEQIFEIVNTLLPWYLKESTMTKILCHESKKVCSDVNDDILTPLTKFVKRLSLYQNHFFENGLIDDYTPKNKQTLAPSMLAFKHHPHGLQVGIEYAIVDNVLRWINTNIDIIKTQAADNKKPTTEDQTKKVPVKAQVKTQTSSSSSSENDNKTSTKKPTEYFDADTVFTDDESSSSGKKTPQYSHKILLDDLDDNE